MLKIQLQHQLDRAFIDINIDDEEPKIYALKGSSGIGKTTALNFIAGLKHPDKAKIQINNRVLTDTEQGVNVKIQKRNLGYLFQDYQLFPNMTVHRNLTFMSEMNAHIRKLMKELNIHHLKDKYPMTLSGGESQRVALARALSTKPDLILLDEPFSSLDDQTKEEGIALVKRIFHEWHIPIIFVTHSNYEAESLADEVLTISAMNDKSSIKRN
ncbi:ATP-binding cassette domain-containing protein [Staphylococcus pettenkoferi]|uniref:ATP-binding cassette domain-containing protein n=1 Tax=Staphylococcus pettenkoferi TaxID=170573 RepID=UPI0022765383|nr:ATP-binding cassette domain-containing protein [Staphylococcus pettenkoferi]MCY1615703.1 ATP-binding cassette domain-containing protein [Staphylococcus pettenkoferi]